MTSGDPIFLTQERSSDGVDVTIGIVNSYDYDDVTEELNVSYSKIDILEFPTQIENSHMFSTYLTNLSEILNATSVSNYPNLLYVENCLISSYILNGIEYRLPIYQSLGNIKLVDLSQIPKTAQAIFCLPENP